MNIRDFLDKIQKDAASLVWWSSDQIARGEDKINDPKKGERPWIIPETTGQFLHDFIIEKKITSVLELGTSIGYSTIWIASALEKTGGHIHTIERSENKISVAENYFQESGLGDVITLHRGEIFDVVKNFPAHLTFDLVFMDADRGHYHEYFPLIKKHLLPGAWIIADNAENMHSRMQPLFDLLDQEKWHHEIKDLDNGILIATDQE